jgi:hypothetical protein
VGIVLHPPAVRAGWRAGCRQDWTVVAIAMAIAIARAGDVLEDDILALGARGTVNALVLSYD